MGPDLSGPIDYSVCVVEFPSRELDHLTLFKNEILGTGVESL